MLYSIINSIKLLLSRPFYILLSLLTSLIYAVLLFFVQDDITGFRASSLTTESLPSSNIAVLPYQLISMYPKQIAELSAVFFLALLLNVVLLFGFAFYSKRLSQKKADASEAIGFISRKFFDALKLSVFFFLVGAFFGTLLWFSLILFLSADILWVIAFLVLAFILVLILIEFILTPIVMAAEELNLKESLKQTFAFSSHHSIEIFILIIVLGIADYIVNQLIIFIEDFSFMQNQWLQNGIEIIGSLIIVSFSALVLTQFYLAKKKELK